MSRTIILRDVARRGFLAAILSTLPMFAKGSGSTRRAPLKRILSLGLRSSEMRIINVEQATTYVSDVTFEAPADAFRIGFGNITPAPYRLDGICFRQSDPQALNMDPSWAYISFGTPGTGKAIPPARAPQPVVVPGNQTNPTGATNVPRIVWSDWIAYATSSAAGRPQMQFRTLVQPQPLPIGVPVGFNFKQALPNVPPRDLNDAVALGDFVSHPQTSPSSQTGTPFAPIYVVQYKSRCAGLQIVVGGDSQLTGWPNFIQLAAFELSEPGLPISVWNTAWGGMPSRTFWPVFDQAIEAAIPSVAVIQGWTANDGGSAAVQEIYLSRARESAARAMRLGAIPIVLKNIPRDLFGTAELDTWERMNRSLDNLYPDPLVFDYGPIADDQQHPGNWRAGLSNDLIHPNLQGELALARSFEEVLKSLI